MELFRIDKNPWGQEILMGISWDLLWLFFGAGILVIGVHIVFKLFWASKIRKQE